MTCLRPSRRHDLRHNPQDAARLRLRSLPRRRIPIPRTTGSSRSRRPTLSSSWSKGWMTKAYLTAPRPVETHDGDGGIIPTCRPVGVPWEVHPCASPRCARPSGESPASSSRPSNPWEDELRFMDRWFSDLPVGPGRTWRREDLYDRRPRLPLRSERGRPAGRDHTQLHSVTLSPRTWPRSVHVQFHARGSTCPWTSWTLWRSTSNGVAGGRVEGGWRPGRAIRPPGDPAFCRAWPGFGTTFSNPLSTV
jgi:hypothetical protein